MFYPPAILNARFQVMCSPRRTASYALGALVDVLLNYFLVPPAPCLSRRTSSYALGALVDVLLNYFLVLPAPCLSRRTYFFLCPWCPHRTASTAIVSLVLLANNFSSTEHHVLTTLARSHSVCPRASNYVHICAHTNGVLPDLMIYLSL